MAIYCGAAFDLFNETEVMNAIIRQNVADPQLRKSLEDRLDWVRTDKK